MTKEDLVRTMAKALAEVCLHAHIVDCCIMRDADLEAEEDEAYLTQPWYELSKTLPVSEEALMAIITGGPSRDWDKDVAALAEYIAAAVLGTEKVETIFPEFDIGKPISPLVAP